jgi:hypothetical protein
LDRINWTVWIGLAAGLDRINWTVWIGLAAGLERIIRMVSRESNGRVQLGSVGRLKEDELEELDGISCRE